MFIIAYYTCLNLIIIIIHSFILLIYIYFLYIIEFEKYFIKEKNMKIAVLSGKGGTGKTLISTNLAAYIAKRYKVTLLDCDTEEPNCSIFIKPQIDTKTEVSLKIPYIDSSSCNRCKKCSENCYYGAISIFKQSHMIFDFLCHGCGLCTYICPCNAIKETEKAIGNINSYIEKDNIVLHEGILNIGQASGVRIIRKMKKKAADSEVTILDSPPGSSCSVVETLKDIDMALVVTEPTPYGLHDVDAVIQLCKNMGIPFSVIINKDCGSYEKMDLYFAEKGIEIVSRIPFSEEISEQSSNGSLLIDGKSFLHIFESICKSIGVIS